MKTCDDIQARLAEAGAAVEPDVRDHLEGCADCAKVRADLAALDRGLAEVSLPDAPDALVAGTLQAVRRAAREDKAPRRGAINLRYLAGGLAATVVVAAALGLTIGRYQLDSQMRVVANKEAAETAGSGGEIWLHAVTGPQPEGEPAGPETRVEESLELAQNLQKKGEVGDYRTREGDQGRADAPGWYDENLPADTYAQDWALIAQLEAQERSGRRSQLGLDETSEVQSSAAIEAPSESRTGSKTKGDRQAGADLERGLASVEGFANEAPLAEQAVGESETRTEFARKSTSQIGEALREAEGEELDLLSTLRGSEDEKNRRFKAEDKEETAARAAPESSVVGGVTLSDDLSGDSFAAPLTPKQPILSQAQAFLDGYRSLEGLAFQEPTGYWANSYIPGDPAMRLLAARLQSWDRSGGGQAIQLEQTVRQVRQPFDAPQEAAMAVYLDADTAAIEGPTRLRLQVGLKGAERQGGHRPAMNVGLVVDPRGLEDPALGQRVRALIAALARARQPGDRFSLTLAGPGGDVLVEPEDFRHGPLQVAQERIFGEAGDLAARVIDMTEALALASDSVRRGDDPNAVLGSSLVLLVTGADLADEVTVLEAMAHRNAVAGVPVSVVSLGGQEDLSHIDRLVAAGQGNRRILERAQAADGLIDRELHAASRAVARALRLRIRLAPGVKLIDVLGSRALGEPQAELVREAERAIDQRLARNLGIEADRGEDEEGIQIVIPSFSAGDDHVILLDLLAEAPGPVAEVTLRYKDLVGLRNGVARASLTLDQGQGADGPLERNVLKNLVAREMAAGTRQAGRALAVGDFEWATARLVDLRALIDGLRREISGWTGDADLAADIALLDEYLAILGSPVIGHDRERLFLAESLTYAAFRKLQPAAR